MIDISLQASRELVLWRKACRKVCSGPRRDQYCTLSSPIGVIFDFGRLETIFGINLWSVLQTEQINFCLIMEFGERNPFETGMWLVCEIVVSANLNLTLC